MSEVTINRTILVYAIFSRILAIILLSLLIGYAGYTSDQTDYAEQKQLKNYSSQELLAHISAKNGAPLSYVEAVLLCFVVGLFFTGAVETIAYTIRWIWQSTSHK